MNKILNTSLKTKFLPLLMERDNGFNCLYCKKPLTPQSAVYEHLNNNRADNRLENIAFSHQSCNIKKVENTDFQVIAHDKLLQNEEAGLKFQEDVSAHLVLNQELSLSKQMYNFTKQYLSERILIDTNISYDDALACIPYLLREKYDAGSEQSTIRYISSGPIFRVCFAPCATLFALPGRFALCLLFPGRP